jgi:hypothetical protein
MPEGLLFIVTTKLIRKEKPFEIDFNLKEGHQKEMNNN